jgi:isoleucyl-tRNA synthetase
VISKNVINLLTNPISALYYNGIKDRLYCDALDDISRKSSQFVLLQVFEIVTQAIAPIVPHLVEEMFLYLRQKNGKTFFTSTHGKPESHWNDAAVNKVMDVVLSIKKDINKEVGASTLDWDVKITFSQKFHKLIQVKNSCSFLLETKYLLIFTGDGDNW